MATRRNLSLAAALAGLLALVAVAARAHAPAGGGTTHGLSSKLVWEFALVGIIGLFILCIPVAIWAVVSTRLDTPPSRAGRRRSATRRIVAGLAIALLAFAAVTHFNGNHNARPNSSRTSPLATTGLTRPIKPGRPIPFDWLPAIAVLSVAGLGAVAIGCVLFRRPRRRTPSPAEVAAELWAVLDESLDDLLAERDPRRAVIAAYARMERTLARAGLPRTVAEAPLEYLGRALRELLYTSAEAVSKLTSLFERAKFSPHEIDRSMKDEAIDALVAVRDELRAAAS